MAARLIAVCRGAVTTLAVKGPDGPTQVISGIAKTAVSTLAAPEQVAVGALGIDGDAQADLTVHGGLDKAVYLYPAEHYPFWQTVRTQAGLTDDIGPGALGENLLIEGLPETGVWIGDRITIGEVALRVESARQPCYKFNARMGFDWASKMMIQSGFTGFYCAVLRGGMLRAGDPLHIQAGSREIGLVESHRLRNRSRRG